MQYFRIKQRRNFPLNIQTSVKYPTLWIYILVSFQQITLKLGNWTDLRRSFQEYWRIFGHLSQSKPEETVQGYINIPYTKKIHVLAINPTTTILAKAFLKSSHLVFPEKIKRDRGSVPIISLIPWQLPYNLICNFHSKTIDRLSIHVIVKHHTCSTSVAFYPWWIESGNLERISWSFYIEIVTWNKKVLATENLISASPSSVDWRPCIPVQKGDAILSCS